MNTARQVEGLLLNGKSVMSQFNAHFTRLLLACDPPSVAFSCFLGGFCQPSKSRP